MGLDSVAASDQFFSFFFSHFAQEVKPCARFSDFLSSWTSTFWGMDHSGKHLGVASNSILARDPSLFRKPSKTTQGTNRVFERTMVEKDGKGIRP